MQQHEFERSLTILNGLAQHELVAAGVIGAGDTGAWIDFTRDRCRWAARAHTLRAERLWDLIFGKLPAISAGDEMAEALFEFTHLLEEFGAPPKGRHAPWLRTRLEIADRSIERTKELLEANNRLQQEARDARRIAFGNRRGIYVASKVRHAATWKALRASGVPIISTWIDEAGEGESEDLADLWQRCIREATTAQVLVVYREPEEILKGGWIEVGAALAAQVPVYAVGIEKFTIAHVKRVTHFPTLDAAIDAVRSEVAVAA